MWFKNRRERKRRKAESDAQHVEQRRYWDEQIAKAQAGDEKAQKRVAEGCPIRDAKVYKIMDQVNERAIYKRTLGDYKELLRKWKRASSSEELQCLVDVISFTKYSYHNANYRFLEQLERDTGVTRKELVARLNDLVQEQYVELTGKPDDRTSFLELGGLIRRTRYPGDYGGDLRDLGIGVLHYPEEWNQLVNRHIANPSRWDFVRLEEFASGQMRLLAAAAIRDDDSLKAKIVLAHCKPYEDRYLNPSKEWQYWRQEVGDGFILELSKLVDRHNLAMELIVEEGQPARD